MTIFEVIGLVGVTLILVRCTIFVVPRAYVSNQVSSGGRFAKLLWAFPNAIFGCVPYVFVAAAGCVYVY